MNIRDILEKVPEEEMKERTRQAAKNNFRRGPNCAESIYLAMIEVGLIDFAPETVALATPFGGGMGLYGGTCGALVGGIMGVGAVHGRRNPTEGSMQEIIDGLYGNPGRYRFINQIPHKFAQMFGTTDCETLNKDYPIWFDKNRFRNCMNIVADTAAMAVEFIYQGAREGYIQPFGKNMAGKE